MRETGTSRRDTAIAAACALLLHAGLGWGVNELLRAEPATADAVDADALQVVWITPVDVTTPAAADASLPAPARLAHVAAPAAKPAAALLDPHTPATATATPSPSPSSSSSSSSKPLSVVALGQARQWVRQQAPLEFADTEAFADRAVDLPGRPANRFRMTPPLSPAELVGLVGVMFGAGPDPCIQNRENIAGYATGRDDKVLQLEVELERRHCRP